jgi:mono/diheme cytochrome c family protein
VKKTGVAIFVVTALIFAVVIPYVAISGEGTPSSTEVKVAPEDEEARDLFATNCGTCHTLARAGTDGVVGPNLDDLMGMGTPEGNYERTLSAIENGINGRMPAGILAGAQAEEVADFVSRTAGK